ncbi:MAG: hypothetical protein RLZZ142_2210 [Verrucomicrobiota bacterium]
MSVLTPLQMQDLERGAFAEGVSQDALMEEAGHAMARAIAQFAPAPGVCLAVFGKGHNGGDALVAARLLSESGWEVKLIAPFPSAELAPLTAQKWAAAGRCDTLPLESLQHWSPDPNRPLILLDGLLGIGATGTLRDPIAEACRSLNGLRQRSHALVFALDLPTGLDGLSGRCDPDAIVADFTLSVGFAKTGLLADEAPHHVGRLAILPLPALTLRNPHPPSEEVATPALLGPLWPRRSFLSHKGDYGRVTLVAGGLGTLGAASLAALGALHAGAGLVTLFVPENLFAIAAATAPPECMVRPLRQFAAVLKSRTDALGLGPGLGTEHADEIREIIRQFPGPAVVDADALNALAGHLPLLSRCAGPRLLTPHPGEMQRIAPELASLSRRETAERFTREWPVTLLLKGSRSLICSRGRLPSYNPTGNPGMASGGMGDVLTGVCTALQARGLNSHDAARLGAWICGKSAESLIASRVRSEESLLASDVARHLGAAFQALRAGSF